MALHHRKPPPILAPFIHALYLFEGSAQPHSRERALPDGCAQIIVNLVEDRMRVYDRYDVSSLRTFNGALIVGPQSEFCIIDPSELLSVAGVHFKPGGAALLTPAVHELHGTHLPLDALWGSFAQELRERLLAAESVGARFDVLEQTLVIRALRCGGRGPVVSRHPAVRFALEQFSQPSRTGAASIAQVVERTGFSTRHFIHMFRREVGLTPKVFCRLLRFQDALRRIADCRDIDWADIALDAGYFDQAHFIHDFRAFSGINPSTYRQTRTPFPNHARIEP